MARPTKVQEGNEGLMNLKEAAAYLGITDQRVRTILRQGRIKAVKNEKGYWRVTKEELDAYNATKGRRLSGRKTYVVRFADEELEVFQAFVAAQGWQEKALDLKPRYNYDPDKAKAYRQARKQKQTTEPAEAS